jgi:hypothetical protein
MNEKLLLFDFIRDLLVYFQDDYELTLFCQNKYIFKLE